eukprot:s910_g12.t1
MGIAFLAVHRMLRSPKFRSSLQEPLLATDTPSSDHSFSVISAQAVPLPQLFLKRTAMSLQEGPPVAAEDLRPNCSVRAATGGWLEVEAVTFKHVQQCDVIQLTLAGDAPNLCITARQQVARASREKEVVPAMELREGDAWLKHAETASIVICQKFLCLTFLCLTVTPEPVNLSHFQDVYACCGGRHRYQEAASTHVAEDSILYHGSCLEVKKFERQTLQNVELVEVLFDADGAVETLADAETESAFHIV